MVDDKHVYTLGLDIGTNSLGWAVIDENLNLVKKCRHSLWGVRMFEDSKAAVERRTYRNARRRYQRRKERIKYLQGVFAKEIAKVDLTFFTRLNESFFKLEDRSLQCNDLFINGLTNAMYFKRFPTIWHLRNFLLQHDEKVDIRFLYLACHHILKYRGNFLTEGEFKKGDISEVLNAFIDINNVLKDLYTKFSDDEEFEGNPDYFLTCDITDDFCQKVINTLTSKMTKNDKRRALEELFIVSNDSSIITKTAYNEFVVRLLLGDKVNPNSLKIVKEKGIEHSNQELTKLDITDESLDAKLLQYADEYYEIKELISAVIDIKIIKDYGFLINFLGAEKYLSAAMVKKYNEHNEQLNEFKLFIKNFVPNKYFEIFRTYDKKLYNYAHYVGQNHVNSSKVKTKTNFSHCKQDEFYSYIKKIIESIDNPSAQEEKECFLKLIENKEFLVRTNSSDNAAFPMQLHLTELKEILNKQAKYYPFLMEVSDNLTNIEKIIKIFMFKRPYYCGPLNDKSEYAWVVRNNYQKVTPWNVDSIINSDETAKKFIEKMQNKCSYLKGEHDYCLPKNSIIFQKYTVFSYINKIKVGGVNIDNQTKLAIYSNIFLQEKKPTQTMIKKYLVDTKGVKADDISGIDVCNCSMSSYLTFKDIFKDKFNEILTRKENNIEDIIKDITVFEDKKILEKRLKEIYKLSPDEIKQIKNLSYKKYGRLCKNLLVNLIFTDKETNIKYHGLLDVMEKTTLNLQEILFAPNFEGNKVIDEYNKIHTITEKMSIAKFIDENLTVSPIYTRALIQTYRLIEELEQKILKTKITYYVVECTRENRASKVSKSRYEKVKELLKECKKLANEEKITTDIDFNQLSGELETNKDRLKADKFYLYFTQLGKDMYTLDKININEISNNRLYDIDHIMPQSIIKDDSISNRVLVYKPANHNKSDKFIFESINITSKHRAFYKMLLDKELITKKKYDLLTMHELDDNQLRGFVNRQKVATDQSVKAVITMLKLFKNVNPENIIYSKANVVSEFRRDEFLYDKGTYLTGEAIPRVKDELGNNLKHIYYKSRTANNYHHAHDAYLNAIIGTVLTKYYDKISIGFNSDSERKEYLEGNYITCNPMKVLSRKVKNTPWNPKIMLPKIEKNLYYNYDVQETLRTYKSNEMLSQVTIIPRDEGNGVKVKNLMPNGRPYDTSKYGGFKQPSYSKFVLIKVLKKNNEQIILQPIPKMFERNLDAYLKNIHKDYEVINANIGINTVIEYGKTKAYLTGVSSNSYVIKNANDRNFDINCIRIIHDIDKYVAIPEKERDNQVKFSNNNIIISDIKNQRQIAISLADLDYLYDKIHSMFSKDIYAFSNIRNIYSKMPNKLDDSFAKDGYKTKLYLINQLLGLLKTNERKSADLTSIGLSKNSGIMLYNIKLIPGMKIVNYSITGLKKKVIYEVK